MRRGRRLLPFVLAVGVVAVVAPMFGTARAATSTAPPSPEQVRSTFLSDCAVCHAADGTGTNMGPSLQGAGRAYIDYELSTGRMPLLTSAGRKPTTRTLQPLPNTQPVDPTARTVRHRPAYPAPMISALVDYVSGLGPGGPDIPAVSPGNKPNGGELFRLNCAACHAWAGDGGALLHREAPSLKQSTSVQVAEAVRVGPGLMPAFGPAALSDHDVNDVVAYVRYLQHPTDRGGLALWHLGPVAEGGVALLIGLSLLVLATRWIGERG